MKLHMHRHNIMRVHLRHFANSCKSLKTKSLLKSTAFVNGKWTSKGKDNSVVDPATGNLVATVKSANFSQVQEAIQAASDAFEKYRLEYSAQKRSRLLDKWYALVLENIDDLAVILTAESGKPLEESRGEIKYGASYIQFYAGECLRSSGMIIPSSSIDSRMMTITHPVGVVAAITPFNFPNAMITRKVAPAIAAGCSVVLKPSSETPLSALALAALAQEAGIPPGMFNVVPTHPDDTSKVGNELASNSTVRKLTFTGSTAVGKLLMAKASSNVKRLSLELGGNAPFIVFEDADLDAAITGAMDSKFRFAGQTCICTNRFYIHENIYESFTNQFVDKVKKLRVGNSFKPDTQIGPLIHAKAYEKVDALVQDALNKGATAHYTALDASLTSNYFYPPTVLTNVTTDMKISQEEIFGPVAVLYSFSSENQVVQLANNTNAGLAAYAYTKDHGIIGRLSENLEYGMVGINTGMISSAQAPFGGMKESGVGREGSSLGLHEYQHVKYLHLKY